MTQNQQQEGLAAWFNTFQVPRAVKEASELQSKFLYHEQVLVFISVKPLYHAGPHNPPMSWSIIIYLVPREGGVFGINKRHRF